MHHISCIVCWSARQAYVLCKLNQQLSWRCLQSSTNFIYFYSISRCLLHVFLVFNTMFCSEPCNATVNWYPVLNRQNRKLFSESTIFLVGIVFSTRSTKKKDDLEESMQQCKLLIDIHNHSKKHCGNEDRACYRISMTWWELIINCWQYSTPVLWQQFCFTDQQILQLH
jgi:hypothetical protein